MASITFILVSIVIVIVALTVVNIANRRETRSRLVTVRISQLKRRVQEFEELCMSVEPLLESYAIPSIINEEIIDSIKGVSHFGEETRVLDIYLENAESRREVFTQAMNKPDMYRAQDSDAKMARALYQLNEANQVLRTRQAKGLIDPSDMEKHLRELSWAHLMVKVVTHIIEGQKAYENNNLGKALAFATRAQQIATETSSSDDRRQALIREIGQLSNKKFTQFSSEFMPEYQQQSASTPKATASGFADIAAKFDEAPGTFGAKAE